MILEAIVTTRNPDGSINIAPMGPCLQEEADRFELRPFQTATTFGNLVARRQGVLNVTDDVLLFVQAALDRLTADPEFQPAQVVDGACLADACRVHEFEVDHVDSSEPRASIQCRVVATRSSRPFFGYNRARHLILEATILATRIEFIPPRELQDRLREYGPVICRTGGPREREALKILQQLADLPGNAERVW